MLGKPNPRDELFRALSDQAARSAEAARHVVDMFATLEAHAETNGRSTAWAAARNDGGDEASIERLADEIDRAGREGNRIFRDTVRRMHERWITPLYHDDIYGLMSRTAHVIDLSKAVATRIRLFDVGRAPSGAAELAHAHLESNERMAAAIAMLPDLSQSSEIIRACHDVACIEERGESVYRRSLAGLLRAASDPIAVLKWRDILTTLKVAIERCKDVTRMVERVLRDYA